jgi:transcriptional regulator GlxA family with amidase domain
MLAYGFSSARTAPPRPQAPAPRTIHPMPSTAPDAARAFRRVMPSAAPALPASLPATFRHAPHLPPRLREALALACDDRRAIRTVEKLAAAAGCDRRTLWTHWKQSVGRHSGLRLQDFLHWVLLLRAAHRKTASRPWAEVAEEIGIHPHTLGRLARQLTGSSLRELSSRAHLTLAQAFETRVLPKVLDPDGTGAAAAD